VVRGTRHLAGALAILAWTFLATAAPHDLVTRGRADFVRYCASCHGLDGDGRGPVAPALVGAPSDLRRLGERHGLPLPADRIARFIDGRDVIVAHGAREMPVWGERFPELPPDEDARERTIYAHLVALLAYLQSIQLGAAPE
jgi:mono/diheme cytochrome c family protein